MKNTRLTIVRHAESTLNGVAASSPAFFSDSATRDLFKNTPDHKVPLTQRGLEQALKTGRGLCESDVKYCVAVHTSYTRTKQTLEQIMLSVKVGLVREVVELRERENGHSYVMTEAEIKKNFPWNERYWKTFGPVFSRPIGGESLLDVCTRVKPAVTDLISEYKGKNILLVTHGRVISVFRFILEKWSTDEFESFLLSKGQGPINCGVTEYSFDSKMNPTLLGYNKKYW